MPLALLGIDISTADAINLSIAVFTALAALGALGTVRHTARLYRQSIAPDLELQLTSETRSGRMSATILNVGGGTAKRTCVLACIAGKYSLTILGDGFFAPADRVTVTFPDTAGQDDRSELLIIYRGLDESVFAVDRDLRCRRMRKGRGKRGAKSRTYPSYWDEVYPELPWPEGELRGGTLKWSERRGVPLHA